MKNLLGFFLKCVFQLWNTHRILTTEATGQDGWTLTTFTSAFMDGDTVQVHAQKEQTQYPAILIE